MEECIFCRIIRGEIPSTFTHQGETLVAIQDLNPQAPVHQLIIPRKHITTLMGLGPEDSGLVGEVFLAAKAMAQSAGLAENGFRVVANCGADGGQTVGHIHFHLLGGRPMRWPPG